MVRIPLCSITDFCRAVFSVIHTRGRDLQWPPHIHLSTTAAGVTGCKTWKKRQFYAWNVMPIWRCTSGHISKSRRSP
ncbi:transposase [Enterobacter bugandensis]|uniref:transposase n=1 Tax=Enterobacter bugandensis TaxID=881260 RepID=UPI0035AB845B